MPFFFITKFVISATFVILLTSFLPLEAKTLLFLLYLLTLLLAEGPSFPCHLPFFFSTKFITCSAIFPRFVNKLLAVAVKILFIFTIFSNFQLLADGPVCLCSNQLLSTFASKFYVTALNPGHKCKFMDVSVYLNFSWRLKKLNSHHRI